MKISVHHLNGKTIAEVISDEIAFYANGDGVDIIGNLYFQGIDRVLMYEKNFSPMFFLI
jgi:hypothetical protein